MSSLGLMATESSIKPERITKPIQLLGAWLAGLLAIDSCFLLAASHMAQGSWESIALTAAAILNVPVFLVAVFVLQTRYRPELQEDAYYSTYISQKTSARVQITREEAALARVGQRLERVESLLPTNPAPSQAIPPEASLSAVRFGINKHLNDKAEIGKTLGALGVVGYSLFGTTSKPKERSVAISIHLTLEAKERVLTLAKELGFQRYGYFDNELEQTDEQVLFGSYGKAEYVFA